MFYRYDLNQRMDLVNACGEWICRIKQNSLFINLYVVDKNFVEVCFNINTNKIEKIEILETRSERLNSFTDQVDLSDLFK